MFLLSASFISIFVHFPFALFTAFITYSFYLFFFLFSISFLLLLVCTFSSYTLLLFQPRLRQISFVCRNFCFSGISAFKELSFPSCSVDKNTSLLLTRFPLLHSHSFSLFLASLLSLAPLLSVPCSLAPSSSYFLTPSFLSFFLIFSSLILIITFLLSSSRLQTPCFHYILPHFSRLVLLFSSLTPSLLLLLYHPRILPPSVLSSLPPYLHEPRQARFISK